jgi:hypothetical protein
VQRRITQHHVAALTWLTTLLMLFPRVLSSTQLRLRSSAFCQFAICRHYHTKVKTTELEKRNDGTTVYV